MDPWEIITAAVALPGAWVISVERRLSKLAAMGKTVDKMDQRVEKIYDHLITKNGSTKETSRDS